MELRLGVDLETLHARISEIPFDRNTRRQMVARAYAAVASETQRELLKTLDRLQGQGLITSYVPVSIVNSVVVKGTGAAREILEKRSDVLAVVSETVTQLRTTQEAGGQETAENRSWAVAELGAEVAWGQGLEGGGVLVGIIDSGASAAHEQLRGNHLPGERGWFDPTGQSTSPLDSVLGHGTGVLSVAVASNVAGKTLGIAPKATWTACVGLPGGLYNNVTVRLCADWMLQTAQPDILINPWQLPDSGCDSSLREILEAWRAAEILAVFPSGNQGPRSGVNHSPANYAGLKPDNARTLSVGGHRTNGAVYEKSSRGPSACDGSTFPDLTAPAQDLIAAYPASTTTYIRAEGTSFAAGLTGGVAALLLCAHPQAAVAQLEAALRGGTIDQGPEGDDNQFGRGRLSVPAAIHALEAILREGTR